jgi:hypothetical protein
MLAYPCLTMGLNPNEYIDLKTKIAMSINSVENQLLILITMVRTVIQEPLPEQHPIKDSSSSIMSLPLKNSAKFPPCE